MVKIGLALGSGGMRGMAHLGALKVLEEEGVAIDCIAGCSIGALIGALYACGHEVDMLINLAGQLRRRHILDFGVPRMGLFSGDKILELMELLTKKSAFKDLNIPLHVIATDLNQGCRAVLRDGSVSRAVRASVSVPGVFEPYAIDGTLYVDGAVLDPTPVDAAFAMGADTVIAVDLSRQNTDFPLHTMFDVIVKSLDIMEYELLRHRAARSRVVLVRPQIAHIAPSAFSQVEECVALGEAAMRENLPRLRELLAATV